MSERVIPIVDHHYAASVPPVPADAGQALAAPLDRFHRPLHDLRISVTDRCNFRCTYCMPKEIFDKHYEFLPHGDLLSFEEITRAARVFIDLGVRKIRLTGGEPLLRKGLEGLVGMLHALRTPEGEPPELTLTTNGSILARKAQALKDAGLDRVTVSLDALDDAAFRQMNDVDFPVAEVLRGIDAALKAGLGPVKVNMVVKRGTNDAQILPMAEHFRGTGVVLRFIEYMDVGNTNGWRMDEVLPSQQVIDRIHAIHPLHPLEAHGPGETAQRWAYDDEGGEIGVISSVTRAFCASCNRARLSMEGKLYLCLFATHGHDVRALLRGDPAIGLAPVSDDQLRAALAQVWAARDDRYSLLRDTAAGEALRAERKVEMSYIGG
ncbi:GTP 3',8-cyclase MoaA [Thiomonas bhubaneswarensis]|uniref:GTP 3',8-cyclase n=1 Tax=Thiomonas bhubaneswarensis TaxID=339866 RepID=A0A0K6IBX2_9BURK|nr:GTP 3',8-cyclase MoaA [Thiomonas bhubaneswarensis]CUB00586.1 cyclic pyranopterin monophosphate synthase subunit MoaA [Thiomonas bhubaneswarensis]